MANDSTELSFVRCTACRSLVPAVSTRCRMCGAGLEGVAKPNVQQHESVESVIQEDPLSAYIEEVAVTPEVDMTLSAKPSDLNGHSEPIKVEEVKPAKKKMVDFDDDDDLELNLDFASKLGRKVKETVKETVAPVVEEAKEVVSSVVEKIVPQENIIPEVKIASAKITKTLSTKLLGWLVTLGEESNAIEIREDKFFVTKSSFKPTDLVIEDDSISNPHALFHITMEKGIMVQDLASDSGVFVKKHIEEDYRRIEIPVKLEHGDKVKFGNREFIVAAVPY